MPPLRQRRPANQRKRRHLTDNEILQRVFESSQEDEMEVSNAPNELLSVPRPSHVLGLVRGSETTATTGNSLEILHPIPTVPETITVVMEETNPTDGILYLAPVDEVENIGHSATTNPTEISEPLVITLDSSGLTPAKISKPDPLGRGKKLDGAWNNFHRAEGQPVSKVTCNVCKSCVSSRAARLRKHLELCKGSSVSGCGSVPDVTPNSERRSRSQRKVTSFIDVVTMDQKKQMDYEVGRYLYATNLPFSHVEHPGFLKMVSKFRPGYKPPSRQTIGSSILDHIHQEVITEIQSSLGQNLISVTIMQDGWKSRSQDAVIAHCITTGNQTYFLNAVSAEENEKTAEYCVALLLDAIKLAEQRFNAEVIAVVTDNCNSMRKMRRLIVDERPEVLTYGCHPHLLNLIGKKLTPETLQEKVEIVHKYFRNHDSAAAILKKHKGIRPVIACTTRWNSWIMCFESYLKNQTKFLEISRMPEAKMTNEATVTDILNDRNLYREVELTIGYLKPIQCALDKLQRSNATLADGVSSWLTLQNDLVIVDENQKAYFDKQFERAVTDVGIAAFMLHPKYRGKCLPTELVDKGHNFFTSRAPFAIIIASQIQQESSTYFSKTLLSDVIVNGCTALEWWQSVKASGKVSSTAVDLAILLMKLPSGSADLERHFSTLGNILNDRRNRLGIQKAEKLCLIYKHLAENCAPGDDGDDWLEK